MDFLNKRRNMDFVNNERAKIRKNNKNTFIIIVKYAVNESFNNGATAILKLKALLGS